MNDTIISRLERNEKTLEKLENFCMDTIKNITTLIEQQKQTAHDIEQLTHLVKNITQVVKELERDYFIRQKTESSSYLKGGLLAVVTFVIGVMSHDLHLLDIIRRL